MPIYARAAIRQKRNILDGGKRKMKKKEIGIILIINLVLSGFAVAISGYYYMIGKLQMAILYSCLGILILLLCQFIITLLILAKVKLE